MRDFYIKNSDEEKTPTEISFSLQGKLNEN